jgi:hypothetical protein
MKKTLVALLLVAGLGLAAGNVMAQTASLAGVTADASATTADATTADATTADATTADATTADATTTDAATDATDDSADTEESASE